MCLIELTGEELVATLLTNIASGGDNAVAIADLLGKLLSRLREEMNEQAGLVVTHVVMNKKERRKLARKTAQEGMST